MFFVNQPLTFEWQITLNEITLFATSKIVISYFTALCISGVSSPCIFQRYYKWVCIVFCVWGPVWGRVFVGFTTSGPKAPVCFRTVLCGAGLGHRAALCCACASARVEAMCCRTFVLGKYTPCQINTESQKAQLSLWPWPRN